MNAAVARRCLRSLCEAHASVYSSLPRHRPIIQQAERLTTSTCFSTTSEQKPRAGGSTNLSSSRYPRNNNNNISSRRAGINSNNKHNYSSNNKNKRKFSRQERTTVNFTNELKALVSSGEPTSLQEAEKRLRYNLRYCNTKNTLARPNEWSFGVVLGAYSKARRIPGSATRAEELLTLLFDTYEDQERGLVDGNSSNNNNNVWLVPSAFCVSAAISAFARDSSVMLLNTQDDGPIERASAIVERCEELHKRYCRPQLKPNDAVYNALIGVISFANNAKGAGRQLSVEQKIVNANHAEEIMRKMGGVGYRPNVRTYGNVINTWAGASSISNPNAADRVEQILQHMEDMYARTKDVDVRPNFFCYTNAIHCWARSERSEAPAKAMEIIDKMERLSDSGDNTEAWPNAFAYCAAINALARSRLKDIGKRTDALLHRMKERGVPIDRAAANAAINAWARSGSPQASIRANEIVVGMEASTYPRGTPDIATWNSLINCYTKSGDPNAPEKAEAVLLKIEKSYLDGTLDRKPQVLTYSAVLQAWAKSNRPDAAQGAQRIIDDMSKTKIGSNGRSLAMQPTSICYDALIDALARSNDEDAMQKIEATLRHMEEQASAGNPSMMPTTRTYQGAILACRDAEGGAAKAERLLRRMIELHKSGSNNGRPNNVVYSACISAFASLNSKEGATKAYDLLREMLIAYSETGDRGIRPNQVTWSAVIHAFANSSEPGSAETATNLLERMIQLSSSHPGMARVTPNTFTFHEVMRAWTNSSDVDPALAAEKAENIMDVMYKLAKSGYSEARPDGFTYAVLINAHARAGNGQRAEELLREMHDLYSKGDETMAPGVVCYTSCIQAWANSSDVVEAISRVEALLDEMRKHSADGKVGLKPNGGTCTSVIDLYCKSGDVALLPKAESLLARMVNEYDAGDKSLKPGKSLSAVLDAFVASGDDKGAERIRRLQQRTKDIASQESDEISC